MKNRNELNVESIFGCLVEHDDVTEALKIKLCLAEKEINLEVEALRERVNELELRVDNLEDSLHAATDEEGEENSQLAELATAILVLIGHERWDESPEISRIRELTRTVDVHPAKLASAELAFRSGAQ